MYIYCYTTKELKWLSAKQWASPTQSVPTVWLTDVESISDKSYDQLYTYLSLAEQLRSDRFRFNGDRRRFILGRGLLRKLLSNFLQESPQNIPLHTDKIGKPYLKNNKEGWTFNISHAGEFVMLAMRRDPHGRRLGVDIEAIRWVEDMHAISQLYFSDEEAAAVKNQAQPDLFFQLWTKREALLKAAGMGLNEHMRSIGLGQEKNLIPYELQKPKHLGSNNYHLHSYRIQNDYYACIAVEGVSTPPVLLNGLYWIEYDRPLVEGGLVLN